MKWFITALVFLLFAPWAVAQSTTTTVTATVLDPNGIPYAGGTGNVTFVPGPGGGQSVISGTNNTFPTQVTIAKIDPTGTFSVILTSNDKVAPPGSQWQFNLCSNNATNAAGCFKSSQTITGATLNLSTQLSAVSVGVGAAIFTGGVNGQYLSTNYYEDFKQQSVTYNPPTNFIRLYDLNNMLVCLTSTGGNACPGAGGSGITGSGTANTFTMWNGPTSITNAPMNVATGVTLSQNPFSINGPLLFPCTNSASGTTTNLLVTLDANGDCITLPNGNTAKIAGVCFSGCGTSGTSQIAELGTTPVIFDNQTTINDYVVAGANGQAHDAGTNFPTGVQVIGIANSVNSGTGTVGNANISILNILNAAGAAGQTVQVGGTTLAGSLVNLNNTTPAAQTNFLNCFFQSDNGTPTSNVSLECPQATSSQIGFVQLAGDLNGGSSTAPTVTGIQIFL